MGEGLNIGEPIEQPGAPSAPLHELLDVARQPQVAARLEEDVAAVAEARQAADRLLYPYLYPRDPAGQYAQELRWLGGTALEQ